MVISADIKTSCRSYSISADLVITADVQKYKNTPQLVYKVTAYKVNPDIK